MQIQRKNQSEAYDSEAGTDRFRSGSHVLFNQMTGANTSSKETRFCFSKFSLFLLFSWVYGGVDS